MGIWWKENMALSEPLRHNRVEFAGDASAIPKSWPVIWRYGQDWHCLQVGGANIRACSLHFMTASIRMTYHTFLQARFIMVREGPEPVLFWARDDNYHPVELIKTGRMVPANRFRPERSTSTSSSLEVLSLLSPVVWV